MQLKEKSMLHEIKGDKAPTDFTEQIADVELYNLPYMVLQDMNRKGHIADNKRRRREIICLKNDAEQLSGLGYTLSSLQAGIKLTDRKTITGSPL